MTVAILCWAMSSFARGPIELPFATQTQYVQPEVCMTFVGHEAAYYCASGEDGNTFRMWRKIQYRIGAE